MGYMLLARTWPVVKLRYDRMQLSSTACFSSNQAKPKRQTLPNQPPSCWPFKLSLKSMEQHSSGRSLTATCAVNDTGLSSTAAQGRGEPIHLVIIWFRRDLRLADNEALTNALAAARHAEVPTALLPVYVIDSQELQPRFNPPEGIAVPRMGPLRCRWLLESLAALKADLQALGSDLAVHQGRPADVLACMVQQVALQQDIASVSLFYHGDVLPESATAEKAVGDQLRKAAKQAGVQRVHVQASWGLTLYHPDDLPYAQFARAAGRKLPAARRAVDEDTVWDFKMTSVSLDPERFAVVPGVMTDFRKAAEAVAGVRPLLPSPIAPLAGLPLAAAAAFITTASVPESTRPTLEATNTNTNTSNITAADSASQSSDTYSGSSSCSSTTTPSTTGATDDRGGHLSLLGAIPGSVAEVYGSAGAMHHLQTLSSMVRLDYGSLLAAPLPTGAITSQSAALLSSPVHQTAGDAAHSDKPDRRDQPNQHAPHTAVGPVSPTPQHVEHVPNAQHDRHDHRSAIPLEAGEGAGLLRVRYYLTGKPGGLVGAGAPSLAGDASHAGHASQPPPSSGGGGGGVEVRSAPAADYFNSRWNEGTALRSTLQAVLKLLANNLSLKLGVASMLEHLPLFMYPSPCRSQAVGVDNSAKLSPYLALGCISPRMVEAEVRRVAAAVTCTQRQAASHPAGSTSSTATTTGCKNTRLVAANAQELGSLETPAEPGSTGPVSVKGAPSSGPSQQYEWLIMHLGIRDFFIYTLLKEGDALLSEAGIRGAAPGTEWSHDTEAFTRWAQGRTGFPFVDASMRELALTGYMSNRGRQNVASFLTKALGIDWRWGAALFECLLVDHDVGANYGNWAYQAGVGNDPRNRVFKTVTQGMRYDEEAELISMWLPELAAASTQHKHMPWDMQPEEKLCCETASGMQYPEPMVDPATQIGKLPKKQAAAAAAAACGEGGSGKRQGAKERRRGKRDSH